jgi:metacaspase-1
MKKALLIGINYIGTDSQLSGCYNDIMDMKEYLIPRGYAVSVLTDSDDGASPMPTRENILAACRELVSGALSGDKLYLHYSGHGSYVRDRSGDERDGADEAICPIDSITGGAEFIIDDELYNILVKGLPKGVKLYVVFDSCHSGSCLDLPHRWLKSTYYRENYNYPLANVISISGCRDNQTSADTVVNGKGNGALTRAFLAALLAQENVPTTWKKFIEDVQGRLLKYTQVPQLSSSRLGILDKMVDI